MHRSASPALMVALLVCGPSAHAADENQAFDAARRRAGAWLSVGLLRNALAFEAANVALQTTADGVPALNLGADVWASDSFGLYAGASLGFSSTLEVPSQGVSLRYNAHQFEVGARGRWHLGPAADALAVFVGFGGRATLQTAQVQRPSLLVDTTAVGPEAQVGLEVPLGGQRFWLRATARAGLPFFVRESPDDSGDAERTWSFGGRFEAIFGLTSSLFGQVGADAVSQHFRFRGEGTRAGAVFNAEADNLLLTGNAGLRYVW
jgi:hypothetical protein